MVGIMAVPGVRVYVMLGLPLGYALIVTSSVTRAARSDEFEGKTNETGLGPEGEGVGCADLM